MKRTALLLLLIFAVAVSVVSGCTVNNHNTTVVEKYNGPYAEVDGLYAGTDDLGRVLTENAVATADDKSVGIFYFLWAGTDNAGNNGANTYGPYDNSVTIQKFREQYPRVSIRITVDSPEKLIQMMEHNELDMIYILDTPRWDSNWIKVMEKAEPVMFVTSVSHRLAKERNLLLDDLLKESFYLTERNANYRQALDGQLALRRKELSPMLEISDTAFIKKMLMRGGGVSFLPRFAVEDDIEKKKLTLLDVKDIEITMYRQIFYHKNKFKTKEMEKFTEFALEDN